MSKFKVGDRVRRVAYGVGWCPLGHETEVLVESSSAEQVGYRDTAGRTSYTDDDHFALVEASPVRSVTRKEIVEGVYGRVRVNDTGKTGLVGLWFEGHYFKPAELRAASSTFLALADALDEVA